MGKNHHDLTCTVPNDASSVYVLSDKKHGQKTLDLKKNKKNQVHTNYKLLFKKIVVICEHIEGDTIHFKEKLAYYKWKKLFPLEHHIIFFVKHHFQSAMK
ncbi:hypothetical protein KIL84_022605 [Mauremys mutica]|uniref:Uncharacterized protein n=1 Tax=Mauremys mutica TaxID=74926 RepID=A0A9D4AQS3_9SAUR|nr:hypothetical protein KIL84_022605 [Mauremys mutica]